MRFPTVLKTPIYFNSRASVCGSDVRRGPLGEGYDFCDKSDLFGMSTWERAEGEMSRIALNIALKRADVKREDLSLLVSGDLQNQCVASSGGLFTFGAPYLGLYGACSTCTEALIVLSSYLSLNEKALFGAAVTSSHNCAAERQFRTPIEYGGQRTPTAQWTSTAAGAFILGKKHSSAKISAFMPGKIVDGYTKDATNMGGAMALGAFDTISSFFSIFDPYEFDAVVTGDLGYIGSEILRELLRKEGKAQRRCADIHTDCGCLIFDSKTQDCHAGGSGCGCSASVLASYFLPKIENGELKKIAFLSTGALMSTQSVYQGDHILGIAPLVVIENEGD